MATARSTCRFSASASFGVTLSRTIVSGVRLSAARKRSVTPVSRVTAGITACTSRSTRGASTCLQSAVSEISA